MMPEQQQRILGYFIEEAKDHLNTLEQGLLNLQETITDPEMVNEVFRAAHSVKGGAAMLGIGSVQRTAHRLEDYFKVLKETPVRVDRTLESMLLQVFDGLQALVEELQGPFGLTDDKAQGVMSALEPVFSQLESHLEALTPAAEAALIAAPKATAAPKSAAAPAAQPHQREESALKLVFRSDVPDLLRQMLGLFKQGDTPTNRTTLQACCDELTRIGEQFDLYPWSELSLAAYGAIGNAQNTYRSLAPVVIKELKNAQEQVLAGRAGDISISPDLQALIPAPAIENDTLDVPTEPTAEAEEPAFAELFDEAPEPDLAATDLSDPFSSDLPTGDLPTGDLPTGDLPTGDLPTGDLPTADILDEPTAAQGQDAVQSSALNNLADLFEGEIADASPTWEEVSDGEDTGFDFLADLPEEAEASPAGDDSPTALMDELFEATAPAAPPNPALAPDALDELPLSEENFSDLFDAPVAGDPAAGSEAALGNGGDDFDDLFNEASFEEAPDDTAFSLGESETVGELPAVSDDGGSDPLSGEMVSEVAIADTDPGTLPQPPEPSVEAASTDPFSFDLDLPITEETPEVAPGTAGDELPSDAFADVADPWDTQDTEDIFSEETALDALDELWAESTDSPLPDGDSPTKAGDDFSIFDDLHLEEERAFDEAAEPAAEGLDNSEEPAAEAAPDLFAADPEAVTADFSLDFPDESPLPNEADLLDDRQDFLGLDSAAVEPDDSEAVDLDALLGESGEAPPPSEEVPAEPGLDFEQAFGDLLTEEDSGTDEPSDLDAFLSGAEDISPSPAPSPIAPEALATSDNGGEFETLFGGLDTPESDGVAAGESPEIDAGDNFLDDLIPDFSEPSSLEDPTANDGTGLPSTNILNSPPVTAQPDEGPVFDEDGEDDLFAINPISLAAPGDDTAGFDRTPEPDVAAFDAEPAGSDRFDEIISDDTDSDAWQTDAPLNQEIDDFFGEPPNSAVTQRPPADNGLPEGAFTDFEDGLGLEQVPEAPAASSDDSWLDELDLSPAEPAPNTADLFADSLSDLGDQAALDANPPADAADFEDWDALMGDDASVVTDPNSSPDLEAVSEMPDLGLPVDETDNVGGAADPGSPFDALEDTDGEDPLASPFDGLDEATDATDLASPFDGLEATTGPEADLASDPEASFDELDSLLEEPQVDFDELDSLLDAPAAEADVSDGASPDGALDVDLDGDLDSLLAEGGNDAGADTAVDDEFSDLEKLLEEADKTLGGSAPVRTAGGNRIPRRASNFADQTMRVSVSHLDTLNNLVGELVVNRNSLEQDQDRLRQFLDNLLFQVQQLNDVGQRMRDLYERSLLESSLMSSRPISPVIGGRSQDLAEDGDIDHATGATFDALELDRFTGFHTLSQEMIELIVRVRESSSDIGYTIESADQITRQFRQVTTQLQEGLNKARMVPFAQTADRLPRAVRDISMRCGKEARLVVEGRDTLIDKMILERLYDPMTHLVNNAITHGVEPPEERTALGKPREGVITVRAFYQGNQTVIYIEDDGAGIDPEVVKRQAIKKGLITRAEASVMSVLEIHELLFRPGFSTRDRADDFAGRGVGMDVVRTALSEIRGAITIDSKMGEGTSFTIRLPLTLSISKALSCLNNQARIAFPMDGVEDMFDVPKERIKGGEASEKSIPWRDMDLALQPLSELLQFNRSLGRGRVYGGSNDDDMVSIVVLRNANTFIGIQVDRVLGEQEIVIKQLEGPIPKPMGIAGATVLGDGRVMPIADVLELIDIAQGRVRREANASLWDQADGGVQKSIPDIKAEPTVLIVDDSITVRELLSMSFGKVGYRVEQARDGQEAWEKLRSGLPCDLVFCDIEMPRMDGLELLSRIQKDALLKRVPIAMLTSRGADRHRQMALDLGASGYFTKPYLEEALLDAAQRMLDGEVLLTKNEDAE